VRREQKKAWKMSIYRERERGLALRERWVKEDKPKI
jgi:hypothetical protein